jgi:hypothetical protein
MSRDDTHPVELLSAFADGETTESERETIAAHLAGCEACRDRLDDLRLLDRVAADEPVPPVPADFVSRLRERLDAERAPAAALAAPRIPAPLETARWGRGLPLAAAASLVVAALLWLLRLEPPQRDLPPGPSRAIADRMKAALPASPPAPAPPGPGQSPIAAAVQADERAIAGGSEPRRAEAKRPGASRPRAPTEAAGDAAGGRSDTMAPKQESVAEQALSLRVAPSGAAPTKDKRAEGESAARVDRLRALGYIGTTPAGGNRDEESGGPAVEAPPYRVRLLADRSMSVETAGYTCVVPVSQEDFVSLAAIVSAAQTRQERAVAAAQAAPAAAPPAPPAFDAAPAAGAPKVAIVSPRVCTDLSAEDCRFVLSLVRERYRVLIEQRCGPPPR